MFRIVLSIAVMIVSLAAGGCGGAALPSGVSASCNSAWAANEKPGGGGVSDELMAATFRACATFAEWKLGWTAHPLAHGSALEPDFWTAGACSVDGTVGDVRNTPVCQDRAAKGVQPPTYAP